MEVVVKPVVSKRDRHIFIYLPAKIHKSHKNWVPPIYMDERTFFNPRKNKSFEYCKTTLVLAWKNGKPVGRIMGIINYRYNKQHNENHGRFAFMESRNEPVVYEALINYISAWAKNNGMVKIVGPFAFSDKDPQGFLVEGFDEPVTIASNCNFPYMPELIEKNGFQKKFDLVVYKFPIPEKTPELHQKIAHRFQQNNSHLKILEFTSRKKLRPYIKPVFHLINSTFRNIYGFIDFTEKEMNEFADRYLYLINPRFIKIIVDETHNVVSFLIAMSDISAGIQKSKGYLIPFGFYHILTAGKKSNQLNLLLGAIDPNYQSRGLDVMMAIRLIESARKQGKETVDSHLELEYNTKVRGEMEKLGGKIYKRFRIYQKDL